MCSFNISLLWGDLKNGDTGEVGLQFNLDSTGEKHQAQNRGKQSTDNYEVDA